MRETGLSEAMQAYREWAADKSLDDVMQYSRVDTFVVGYEAAEARARAAEDRVERAEALLREVRTKVPEFQDEMGGCMGCSLYWHDELRGAKHAPTCLWKRIDAALSSAPAPTQGLREYVRVLHNALEELGMKMTEYSDERGEMVTAYVIPTGPWHRVLAMIRGSLPPSYVADRLDANAPTGEQIAAEVAQMRQRRDRTPAPVPTHLEPALAFCAPAGRSSMGRNLYDLACWTTEPDRAAEYLRKPDYLKIEWRHANAPHKIEILSGGSEFAPNRSVMAFVTFEDGRVETRCLSIVDPADYDDKGERPAPTQGEGA